jgi:LmbE family N-acetylglucosaminyl deacetylase
MHRAQGKQVFILLLTRGEKGGDPSVRCEEAKVAADIIGAELLEIGRFPDGALEDHQETVAYIESNLEKTAATVVFSPSAKDRHQDHRKAAYATIAAARYIPEVYMYETPATIQEFSPQLFVDIRPYLDLKKKALRAHGSQSSRSYFAEDAVEGLSRYRAFQAWGGRAATGAVEAFEVGRLVVSSEDPSFDSSRRESVST